MGFDVSESARIRNLHSLGARVLDTAHLIQNPGYWRQDSAKRIKEHIGIELWTQPSSSEIDHLDPKYLTLPF